MTVMKMENQGLTFFSRFVLAAMVLPLLFIAGVQLFVFSEQTEIYFAWTFASPFAAAFLGAGYWAAMAHTVIGLSAKAWVYVRSSLPAALTATSLLTITTFLHLDKFHLVSPLLITRFVTWVWIAVYLAVPPILALAWILQSRSLAGTLKGAHPLPIWMRAGFALLAVFALLSGIGLFLRPEAMSGLWPVALAPLAARAVSSWLCAFGVACTTLIFENDIKFGAGTCASLFAFCILELIVVARYPSAIDWAKPMAFAYLLFFALGVLVTGANLLASLRTK